MEEEAESRAHIPSLQFFRAKKSTADRLRFPLEMYSRATRNGFSGRPILPCSTVQLVAMKSRGETTENSGEKQAQLSERSCSCWDFRAHTLHQPLAAREGTLSGSEERGSGSSTQTFFAPFSSS